MLADASRIVGEHPPIKVRRETEIMARKASVAGALLVLFGIIQFVPIEKTNPPTEKEIDAPIEVRQVFRRACYDCHSNETSWPWYSSVAPISWLMVRDVREGRQKVNFTAWKAMEPEKEAELIEEIREEVEDGEMPPWFYRWVHPESRMADSEKTLIRQWSRNRKGNI